MAQKILVTCAGGRVGSELVKLLIQSEEMVRAAMRDPSSASKKFSGQVETIMFDYDRPDTFAPALEEIDKVFLMVRPGDNHSDKAAIPLVDEAKKKGIRHIVDLTALGVEKDEDFMLRKLEKYIEDSGIPFTHLRPNWFMQNFNSGPMYADIQSTGALHLPSSDAKISFIDVRDIAAAGFTILKENGHMNKAYTLTGGESLDHFQAIEIISEASKKKFSYIPLSDETARKSLAGAGVPADLIERWSDFYRRVRDGHCAAVSGDIASLLRRSPITFRQYAEDFASSWN
ncbi:MAG TPA: SDR family oxidoreductase [Ignavibacteriaceae bacterium]|nr:SDR family oxidoreductase [Ignavibacteriaceae bacterium]